MINAILDEKFQLNLSKIHQKYKYNCNLMKIAKPILKEVAELHWRIPPLKKELRRQYAIFKNNNHMINNSRYIQENFNICYGQEKTINKFFFGRVLSKKLGWKWLKSKIFSGIHHVLYLQTFDQIYEIENLSKQAKSIIDDFEKLIEGVKTEIQSNIKTEVRSKIKNEKRKELPPTDTKIRLSLKDKKIQEPIHTVRFQANLDLPDNWLVGSDGQRYQIILGIPVSMDEKIAKEFEMKGLGKIL